MRTAGDVNGDGYSDLIAGAPFWSDDMGQVGEGAGFVFHGSSAVLTATSIAEADAVIEGDGVPLRAGAVVAGLSDVNGDGFDDEAVGVPGLAHPENYEGGIAIFHGGATGIAQQPDAGTGGRRRFSHRGKRGQCPFQPDSIGAGDVNGDRPSDMIVGRTPVGEIHPRTQAKASW